MNAVVFVSPDGRDTRTIDSVTFYSARGRTYDDVAITEITFKQSPRSRIASERRDGEFGARSFAAQYGTDLWRGLCFSLDMRIPRVRAFPSYCSQNQTEHPERVRNQRKANTPTSTFGSAKVCLYEYISTEKTDIRITNIKTKITSLTNSHAQSRGF